MADPLTTVFAAGVVLAGLGYLGAGFRARGDWATPAGPPFVAMVVANGLVAVALGAVAIVSVPSSESLSYLLIVLFFPPVVWGFFAMAYTGWRRLVTPAWVGVVTSLVSAPILLFVGVTVIDVGESGLLNVVTGLAFVLSLVLSIGLCIVGIAIRAL